MYGSAIVFCVCEGNELGLDYLMTPCLSEDIGVMYAHTFSKLANHLAQIHTSLSEPKARKNKL